MKKLLSLVLLLFSILSFSQVGIGTTSPNTAAQLEVTSTTKGLLPPRMTYDQRNAINLAPAGLLIWCSDCATNGEMQVFDGTTWTNISGVTASLPSTFVVGGGAYCDALHRTQVVEITSSTSKTWMDRNLGASQVANSSNDYLAYGCMYQWGRGNDGHASINWTSATAGTAVNGNTTTTSDTNTPGHSSFIISGTDWRTTANNDLWSTVTGSNNPCPLGFRVPSLAEFTAEFNAYTITNASTAFTNGPSGGFKFVKAGDRSGDTSNISGSNTYGVYWTSTTIINGSMNGSMFQGLFVIHINDDISARNFGSSVRCIKN